MTTTAPKARHAARSTTRKATSAKVTASMLESLFNNVRAEGDARSAVIASVKTCGGDQPNVRAEVIAARMIRALFPASNLPIAELRAKVDSITAKPGNKSKEANRRTDAQEKAYGAARAYWTAILKDAGIKSTDKRAGNANGKAKASKAKSSASGNVVALTSVAIPTATNAIEVHGVMDQLAALLLAFANKNGKAMGVKERAIVTQFRADVKALCDADKAPAH